VQFVEVSDLGVRVAIHRLRRANDPVEFVLFPMLHVGAAEFYADVQRRLEQCDVILFEGVRGLHASLLTATYRMLPKAKRLGLVAQEGMDLRPLAPKLVHSDISGQEFEYGWRHLSLGLRLLLYLIIPIYAAYMYFFGTREVLASYADFDDLPSREEVLAYDERFEPLDDLLLRARDGLLLQRIEEQRRPDGMESKVVGILFGAAHMRAVTAYLLRKLRYQVADAEWLTVFDL
jgi:hypothetical protein